MWQSFEFFTISPQVRLNSSPEGAIASVVITATETQRLAMIEMGAARPITVDEFKFCVQKGARIAFMRRMIACSGVSAVQEIIAVLKQGNVTKREVSTFAPLCAFDSFEALQYETNKVPDFVLKCAAEIFSDALITIFADTTHTKQTRDTAIFKELL